MRTPKRSSTNRSRRSLSPASATVYCTECGATLENFCFSGDAGDLEAIRRNLARCRRQGRFAGEVCSKLFIAEAPPDPAPEPGEESAG